MHRRHIIIIWFSLSFLKQSVIGIANEHKVADDAMQYMVSVQSFKSHVCGGFLVSENYVLTAAHCSDKRPNTVVLGSHNLKRITNKKNRISIAEQIKHPSYEGRYRGNDLMLLKLKTKANLGRGVKIIQLPNENMRVEAGVWCEIAGWGANDVGKTDVKDLYGTNVFIMDKQTCSSIWPNLPPDVICAHRNNNIRIFHEGDCGGPLVCNNTAVGIISFNIIGLTEGPNVFVHITQYLQWINEVVGLEGSEDHRGSERIRVCVKYSDSVIKNKQSTCV